jgi:putative acetyltransferase
MNPIEIREEAPDDLVAVREVNERAFGQKREGHIVDALRANGATVLSLVAVLNGHLVGHICYSPVSVNDVTGAGLGSMAVVPEHQRQGIGTQLVTVGNRNLRNAGCPFIVVLGHVDFYPRFGFRSASRQGIRSEWNVPDDVFMVLVLNESQMQGVSGVASYRHEFTTVL